MQAYVSLLTMDPDPDNTEKQYNGNYSMNKYSFRASWINDKQWILLITNEKFTMLDSNIDFFS